MFQKSNFYQMWFSKWDNIQLFWKPSLTLPGNWSPKEGEQLAHVSPTLLSLFSRVSIICGKTWSKLYDLEDAWKKLLINFKVHIMLSGMMKSNTVLFFPTLCVTSLSLCTVYPRHIHNAPGWALVPVLVCSSVAVVKHWPEAKFRDVLSGI